MPCEGCKKRQEIAMALLQRLQQAMFARLGAFNEHDLHRNGRSDGNNVHARNGAERREYVGIDNQS